MARRGGKRARAGRKAKGPLSGKFSNFSTRITRDTREALEAEAAANGWSVSQAAERLLRLGIEVRRERERDSATQALNYLIGELAKGVVLASPDGKRFEWNTDAFICSALGITIGLLLDELRPQGKSNIQEHFSGPSGVHPLYREALSSPESWAKHVFLSLWDELTTTAVQPLSEQREFLGPFFEKRADAEWSQHTYDLDRARRALGFRENKS